MRRPSVAVRLAPRGWHSLKIAAARLNTTIAAVLDRVAAGDRAALTALKAAWKETAEESDRCPTQRRSAT